MYMHEHDELSRTGPGAIRVVPELAVRGVVDDAVAAGLRGAGAIRNETRIPGSEAARRSGIRMHCAVEEYLVLAGHEVEYQVRVSGAGRDAEPECIDPVPPGQRIVAGATVDSVSAALALKVVRRAAADDKVVESPTHKRLDADQRRARRAAAGECAGAKVNADGAGRCEHCDVVVALPAIDRIAPRRPLDCEGVVAGTSIERIVARAAAEKIVAGAARDEVVPVAAVDRAAEGSTGHGIIAASAVEHVPLIIGDELIVEGGTGRGVDVDEAGRADCRRSRAGTEIDHHGGRGEYRVESVAVDEIVAG